MAVLGNHQNAFLTALSDFWLRFFKDVEDIQSTYEGTSIELGQVYLSLLNDVLNVNVDDATLFEKRYYKLLSVREDLVRYVEPSALAAPVYVFECDEELARIPQLQNKVYEPTAALEGGLDYHVVGRQVWFYENPLEAAGGYASRLVDVPCGGAFQAPSVTDWTTTSLQPGDKLTTSVVSADLSQYTTTYDIVAVTPEKLYLASATPAPEETVPQAHYWCAWRERQDGTDLTLIAESAADGAFIQNAVLRVREMNFWALDAQVDHRTLYYNFGHHFGESTASSESYRAFIKGLMQLYMLGPALDRMESALNVVANLPVVRDDGEVLQSYEEDTDAGTQRVVTDKNTYVFPLAVPLRADVRDDANFGQLTFRAFEALSSAIRVVDHVKDPTWWYGITLPEEVLPGLPPEARVVHTRLFRNVIGSEGGARIGDLGLRIGANQLGQSGVALVRRHANFILTDRYLKYHLFGVFLDPALGLGSTRIAELKRILLEHKPAHTALYFQA